MKEPIFEIRSEIENSVDAFAYKEGAFRRKRKFDFSTLVKFILMTLLLPQEKRKRSYQVSQEAKIYFENNLVCSMATETIGNSEKNN